MSKIIWRIIEIIFGIGLIGLGVWIFSLFGSLNYCIIDIQTNPDAILGLCYFFHFIVPIIFLVFGILIIFNQSKEDEK